MQFVSKTSRLGLELGVFSSKLEAMKIISYISVVGTDVKALDEAVNEQIAHGYQPHEQPYVSDRRNAAGLIEAPYLIIQPMVKYES